MPDRPKVIILGFSKTATTTLHKFFARNGYGSVHWALPDGRFLAGVVGTNVTSGRPALASIDSFDVYSEFSYADGKHYLEANYFFRELHRDYPDAYFLLNTRETDPWIGSRAKHVGHDRGVRGLLIDRIARAYGTTSQEARDVWRAYHAPFHQEVRAYFADRPEARFLEFKIERDGPAALIRWLEADYTLDAAHWASENQARVNEGLKERFKRPIRRLYRRFLRR